MEKQLKLDNASGKSVSRNETTFGELFLVGWRYGHHAQHSGYESFRRYLNYQQLKPPVKFRYLKFNRFPGLGWKIDLLIANATRRKYFATGLLLTELSASAHMMAHKGAIYHVLYGDTDIWMLGRAGRRTGNRVVATFHEPPEILESLIDQRLAESLDAVILVSECQRPLFERMLPPERIFVTRHGVDTGFFQPVTELSRQPTCITVGSHLRDFETLSQAIDLVLAKRSDVHFVAVGTYGEKGRPPFRHPRVEHLDGISDEELRSRYQSAWAGVFCFQHVTANNAVLEAMACGVPVVVTDTGGIREYVGPSSAILCPERDPESVANGLLAIIEDESRSRIMRSAAREDALKFDFTAAAEQHAQVYSRLASL